MSPSVDVIALIYWILGFFSVLTWTILIVKLYIFFRLKRANRIFLQVYDKITHAAELSAMPENGRGSYGHLASAMQTELLTFGDGQALNLQARSEMLRHSLNQARSAIQTKLESGLAALASIGAIAPILGLLGTVWGIMEALKQISITGFMGMQIVAGPISDALITTAVGIIVAIPAILTHNYFLRRVRVAVTEMESFSERLQHLAIRSEYRVEKNGDRKL